MGRADSLEKTLMLGKMQEEKGTTEDEMVGWHHHFNGHEFEQTLGVGDGRESWNAAVHGVAEPDMMEQLNWTVFLSNLRKIVFNHIILAKRTHVLRTWIWLSISVEMHILVIIQLLEDRLPVLRFFLLLVTVKCTQGENSQRMYTSTS